jgi:hypothetical protein
MQARRTFRGIIVRMIERQRYVVKNKAGDERASFYVIDIVRFPSVFQTLTNVKGLSEADTKAAPPALHGTTGRTVL